METTSKSQKVTGALLKGTAVVVGEAGFRASEAWADLPACYDAGKAGWAEGMAVARARHEARLAKKNSK
jgi:hypothetical protein